MSTKLSYKDAGVDIEAGNSLVNRIKPLAAKTHRPGQLGGIGGFGALFEIPLDRYQNPVLVTSTDGVGTKLKLAIDLNVHHTIGIDLVAMCANDIIVQGAEPLFFLDYYATGKLDVDKGEQIVQGIVDGCQQANMALVGGETAEMPGLYQASDYDLAGFVVGIVEKNKIITGQLVQPGDQLIALPSSGLHSNGYSLARKVLETGNHTLNQQLHGQTLGSLLLQPTKIYVRPILQLLSHIQIKAMAHITGGGITENLPRVLPENTHALINLESWTPPAIFQWLKDNGDIEQTEMLRTFNCGVGFILCISQADVTTALSILTTAGEKPWVIGQIIEDQKGHPIVAYL